MPRKQPTTLAECNAELELAQKMILLQYAKEHRFPNPTFFVDEDVYKRQAHTRGNKHAHCHSARAKGRYAAHIHFQGKALRKAKHGPIYAAQRQQGARKRLLHCGRPSLPGSPLCAGDVYKRQAQGMPAETTALW